MPPVVCPSDPDGGITDKVHNHLFGNEMVMNTKRTFYSLQKIGRISCIGGGLLVLLTIIAFVATAIYETIVPPTDMHLPGLLTAAMMRYVAPVGGILLVSGGLTWIGMFLVGRSSGRQRGAE